MVPSPDELSDRLAALAVLADPARRSVYLHVAGQPEEVSRDEVASGTGLTRAAAAFHLDKLADAGLLETSFRRLGDRRGPGAGRPSKLYRPSSRQHDVSLPPRDYRLAAELLARALDASPAGMQVHVTAGARRFGEELGTGARARLGRRPSRERRLGAIAETLGRHGYHPMRTGARLTLRNCPFQALAEDHTQLICGMNLALLEGVVAGMGAGGLDARFDPAPDRCCVTVGPVRPAPAGHEQGWPPPPVAGPGEETR